MFNCTGYSQEYYWLVNDKQTNHPDNSHRGLEEINEVVDSASNLKIHVLKVPAEPKNNGISIKCTIYSLHSDQSGPVYLYVQGT